jgi:hypothetical protein
LGSGWAYWARHNGVATIAVIAAPRPRRDRLPTDAAAAFDVSDPESAEYLGRRPAFAQAAGTPIRGPILAIGDAAFAHDPIGGRGLSFALGSAFAAAATLKTWRDRPDQSATACLYFERYVAAERTRHLAFLEELHGAPRPLPPTRLPKMLQWCGRVVPSQLSFPDGIAMGDAVCLSDGGQARWVGGFDLLRLRDICVGAQPSATVLDLLTANGLAREEAQLLLTWALDKHLIR